MSWIIENGELTNTEFIDMPSFEVPYAAALWRVENGELTTGLLPEPVEKALEKPYPAALWRLEDGRLTTGILPEEVQIGAFCHAAELRRVSIPDSVKKIGEFAFRNTALKSVKIAEDCEYYETSFPDGCEITGGPWEQLEDKNGDALTDVSGAKIKVRRT